MPVHESPEGPLDLSEISSPVFFEQDRLSLLKKSFENKSLLRGHRPRAGRFPVEHPAKVMTGDRNDFLLGEMDQRRDEAGIVVFEAEKKGRFRG